VETTGYSERPENVQIAPHLVHMGRRFLTRLEFEDIEILSPAHDPVDPDNFSRQM
jgi:hypothetical protein